VALLAGELERLAFEDEDPATPRCPDTLYYLQVLVFSASMRWASFRRLGFFR